MALGKLRNIRPEGKKYRLSLALLVLALASLFAWYIIPQPKVGIIRITGPILGMDTAERVGEMIMYAEEREDIRAVVLEINSPGGSAAASEEIYLDVLRLKEKKPVVASIGGLGASGAYYIASGTNRIYAKPASFVGSIGVVSTLPEHEEMDRNTITTGPFKRTGYSRREHMYNIEQVQESFLNAVMNQRGERLNLSKKELAQAIIYTGIESYRKGLIDDIGSTADAVEKAAHIARISNYGVVDINNATGQGSLLDSNSSPTYINESQLPKSNTVPVNYYLYLEVGG